MENKECCTCINFEKGLVGDSCANCFNYNKFKSIEDKIINPDYYSNSDIDVIEFCNLNNIEFWCGNVIKYCVRSGKKSKEKETDDLRKAIRYIERRIDFINRK